VEPVSSLMAKLLSGRAVWNLPQRHAKVLPQRDADSR